ncbi:hypothetical protein E3P92_02757 [Wallemia ichthyophaga]|uniref:Uncharacterized protein n=2 Tax=Wallemia ichthyophaga TaxID=245174 RepID=A0A4T0I2E9_WALIC|nr:uncharacterized protein J056_004606 [Wallemia ichthyophaga EXF-994]TIA71154.1 hypothetical protein E3P91_02710 [Wallemia ichthyophaga]EOR01285.1 hypothetical protein J056_004606 [Wallemia ichthyophaga EXF-994]TIA89718.1 hypothetical protein E3P97_02882 [Wallemia ichthyophaga]TIA98344.1 hypothetical protein E3P95_02486 [Wallemia ichthyophaga]TIA99444.1 hypothetical protein E3P94_02533 [Wallemia ichthyophaga]
MVGTQKSRASLERELEEAEGELSRLEALEKSQKHERARMEADDDDVDVGFNDDELEALLDRLAESGESDALTALGNKDSDKSGKSNKKDKSDENTKAIQRYNDEIGLNQAFTGIMFNPPQLLSQDEHINHLSISGALPSFLNHNFSADVKIDTISGQVADLKLNCAIPQLRGCIRHIEHSRSLPLFFQTVRKLGDMLQYFSDLRHVLMLRYQKHVLSFDTNNMCFIDHKQRRLIFTHSVKWNIDYSRLEPAFSLYGRLGDEQPNAEARVMLQSLSVNFLRMIQLGFTVQKALEAVIDVFLYAQRTPLTNTQKQEKAVGSASRRQAAVDGKRALIVREKRKERREHNLRTLFESRGASTEAQKQEIVDELKKKKLRKLREAKKKAKTDKKREEKVSDIRQRKKEQMKAEKKEQLRRSKQAKRDKQREENEKRERDKQAREDRENERREQELASERQRGDENGNEDNNNIADQSGD